MQTSSQLLFLLPTHLDADAFLTTLSRLEGFLGGQITCSSDSTLQEWGVMVFFRTDRLAHVEDHLLMTQMPAYTITITPRASLLIN